MGEIIEQIMSRTDRLRWHILKLLEEYGGLTTTQIALFLRGQKFDGYSSWVNPEVQSVVYWLRKQGYIESRRLGGNKGKLHLIIRKKEESHD